MPDFKDEVRRRLSDVALPQAAKDGVIAELAGHLEEVYEEACARGLGPEAARQFAMQEVDDWHVLAENIARAKSENLMNNRTKSLWLPGMVTLLGASVFLLVIQRSGFQPRLVWFGHAAMLFYWPWLAGLPVFGGLGAYLSQRAEAPLRTRLATGLAPALVLLAVMCFILPWGLAIDGFSTFRLFYFVLTVANWVVIPGLALLLGALPFLRNHPKAA